MINQRYFIVLLKKWEKDERKKYAVIVRTPNVWSYIVSASDKRGTVLPAVSVTTAETWRIMLTKEKKCCNWL